MRMSQSRFWSLAGLAVPLALAVGLVLLPTARGEDGRRFPWGDEWVPENAAHRGGRRHTLPVRSIPESRSPHGLYDCAGNVWEWCADAYAEGLRSARGGSWNAHPPQLRCAARNAWPEEARFSNLGFRLVR